MGEKKNGNKKGGDGEKKEKGSSTIVFNVNCLCDGCTDKVRKCIGKFEGVETVKTERSSNKVTVIGTVDPTAIKEKFEKETKKKLHVISPQPKKDDDKEKKKKKPEKEKNQDSDNKPKKKPKEASVTTVDLKVRQKCQCDRCIDNFHKIVSETKGVHEFKVDQQKELVTVKGTMDVKALAEALKDKLYLKKNVEIVAPKKEKEGNNEGGESGGGGGKKKNKGGNGGGGDGGNEANAGGSGGGKMDGNRLESQVQPQVGYMPGYPGYGHPAYGYGYGHPHPQPHWHGHGYPGYVPGYPVSAYPPHQMFNDENPNACAIL